MTDPDRKSKNRTLDIVDDDHIVLLISVKDTGIGIKDEDRDRLFIRFERLDHNNTRSIEGTGLGLAIAANLIRMMDGIEALAAAKRLDGNKNTDTPYIALTANAIAGAREMYLDAGFSDYLSKPMKIDVLSKVISENLN